MTRSGKPPVLGIIALGMVWIVGCGESTGNKQKISGTVTFKGQPLDQGRIDFFPTEKTAPGAAADIQNGKYTVVAKEGLAPGTYRVVISSMSGKEPPPDELPGEAPIRKERIPAKYNEKSDLKAEVKAGVDNVFDFKLD
jgi:hypothetical protein